MDVLALSKNQKFILARQPHTFRSASWLLGYVFGCARWRVTLPIATSVVVSSGVHLAAVFQVHGCFFEGLLVLQCNMKTLVCLPTDRASSHLSEESKQMIQNQGNVDCFELCEISLSIKIQCLSCFECQEEGIVCCICGACLVHQELLDGLSRKIRRTDHP